MRTAHYNRRVIAIRFRRRATVVLAAFVAALVVMVLAPFVHPVAYELVCSATGNKRVAVVDHTGAQHGMGEHDGADDGGAPSHDDHGAHCPLCMPAGAPPALAVIGAEPVQPLAHVLQSIPAARLASLVGAPLPARGPPLAS